MWLHGASVGEGLSLLPLVEALRAADPALSVLVTSGTVTSAELLARRLPEGAFHQFAPVDAPRAAARFLEYWRPDLAVFAESEIWPNLLSEARAAGTKTALVSARLSSASLKRWGRAPAMARALFGGFDLVLAQDDETATGLARHGARDDGRLNLKLIGDALPADPSILDATRHAIGDRPMLLAASTHPGEEALMLDVFRWLRDRPERPLLVIVPRHPERGDSIAALAGEQGFRTARRSIREPLTAGTEVYVADTLGELGLWFRLARAAFIGGSLVEGIGGHNSLEPARLGCPAISGSDVANWASVYDALREQQAVRMVGGPAELAGVFAEALVDPAELKAEAARAAAFAARQSGALDLARDRLLALLP